jgi:hypothetical protein
VVLGVASAEVEVAGEELPGVFNTDLNIEIIDKCIPSSPHRDHDMCLNIAQLPLMKVMV